MNINDETPKLLSDFIVASIKDIRAWITQPETQTRYIPGHDVWHEYFKEIETCIICFAGAWMMSRLNEKQEINIHTKSFVNPEQFAKQLPGDNRKLETLCFIMDWIRNGCYAAAVEKYEGVELGMNDTTLIDGIETSTNIEFTTWSEFRCFLDDMDRVAGELKKLNH